MRRRKLTPEVIVKGFTTFLIGAAVGFASYHLTGLIISRTAFAESETKTEETTIIKTYPFIKTTDAQEKDDLDMCTANDNSKIKKNYRK